MTTNWTTERKLAWLLALPWTVSVAHEDSELVATVEELSGAVATGANERALHSDLYESLEAVLEAMLAHGDFILTPGGRPVPWDSNVAPVLDSSTVHASINRGVFERIHTRALSSASSRVLVA